MPCHWCACGERMTWNIGDTLLGKYRVERVIGQGGMGVVLAVRHVELGELYAIKMMHTRLPVADDAAGRFVREARASARLKGDHVVRVHDVGRTEEGDLYMVMDYLEGMDLKTYLAEKGRLPIDEAVGYILQACEGIAEAHEAGIVHRDIKPANLFLVRKRKAEQFQVKVLDFGISKDMNPDSGTNLTQSGTMLGSPLYMSPEQMQYAHQVDSRTDIWALGVVLYELVTGKVPFPGETMTQVVHSVMHLEPKPLQHHVPEIDTSLDSIIAQCLKKDANLRLASIENLIEALRGVANSAPRAHVGPDVTIKEKLATAPKDVALEATAAAMAFEPTVATPAPMAKTETPMSPLTHTERIVEDPPPIQALTALPLSKTLESAKNQEEPRPSVPPAPPPSRKSLRFVLISGAAVMGIGIYSILRFMVPDERPMLSVSMQSASPSENPTVSVSLPVIMDSAAPSLSAKIESAPSAIVLKSTDSAPPMPQNPPRPIISSALAPPPSPAPTPPTPPSPPASPSLPRWNGPL